jgi:hypothetical protein
MCIVDITNCIQYPEIRKESADFWVRYLILILTRTEKYRPTVFQKVLHINNNLNNQLHRKN